MANPHKRKVKANEMFDGEGQFISMVERGANGVPFRIMKSEDGMNIVKMLKLEGLFETDIPKTPEVLAVVTPLGIDVEKAVELLKKAGLDFSTVTEVDDGFIFSAEGTELTNEGNTTVKLSDTAAVIVANVSKEFAPFTGSTDFSENLASLGFFPGVHLAQDVFTDTLFSAMFKADSKTDAATLVGQLSTDFGSSINALVNELPESVFKLETVLKDASAINGLPGFPISGMGSPPPGGDASDKNGDEIAERPVMNKADKPGHEDEEDGKPKKGKSKEHGAADALANLRSPTTLTDGEARDAGATIAAKSEETNGVEFKEGESEFNLQEAFKDMDARIKATFACLEEQVSKISFKADEAVKAATSAQKVARKTDATLAGTVGSAAPGDEALEVEDSQETNYARVAHIDTALEARQSTGSSLM